MPSVMRFTRAAKFIVAIAAALTIAACANKTDGLDGSLAGAARLCC